MTNSSPAVGPKAMLALKVQDVQTGEVLTLLEGENARIRPHKPARSVRPRIGV